jgi:tRNA(Ile)-lysidine synthase
LARARHASASLSSKHPLIRRVERALAANGVIQPGSRVVAAVSGGADSVFLLRALHALSAVRGFTVEVAHFNHGWRGSESDDDATFAADLSRTLGLTLHHATAPRARRRGGSPEEVAREARYRFLARVALARDADVVTGHTLDDQLETYLLGWLRGSGPVGASLMPSSAPLRSRAAASGCCARCSS